MVVTLGQQHNIGEKPTVMLYTYLNRRAGTPDKTKQKHCSTYLNRLVSNNTVYENSKGLGQQ